MKIKIRLLPILAISAIYMAGLSANRTAYFLDGVWGYKKSLKYAPISREYWQLRDFQNEVIEESESFWRFVPGSFLWRLPERPELGFPPRDRDPWDLERKEPKVTLVNGLEDTLMS